MKSLEIVFERLWEIYISQNPTVKKVHDLFTSEGEIVINDHIAFRTFDHPKINIDVLSKIFLNNGYQYIQSYEFEEKKLHAKHFEHITDKKAPRVFISQLKTNEFSDYLQSIVNQVVDNIPSEISNSEEIIFSGNSWGTPSYKIYDALRKESEYAAWVYYNGFVANHFTVSINHLKKFDTIEKVNEFLKHNGFKMNDSGGEIKGTPEQLLEQSSIKADLFEGHFIEGEYELTGCYYEFARRYKDLDGNLYSGFIAKSADKIFESTDLYKG